MLSLQNLFVFCFFMRSFDQIKIYKQMYGASHEFMSLPGKRLSSNVMGL